MAHSLKRGAQFSCRIRIGALGCDSSVLMHRRCTYAEGSTSSSTTGLNLIDPVVKANSRLAAGTFASSQLSCREPVAWREIPTWVAIATQDRTIVPDLQWQMSERSGARTIEIDGGHLLPMSHPDEVTALIEEAAETVR